MSRPLFLFLCQGYGFFENGQTFVNFRFGNAQCRGNPDDTLPARKHATGLEEPPLQGGTAAITGGTGRYRAARGEIRYADNPDGTTTLDVTFED